MTERVFVQVVGFSDEERHALNTWFRMSQQPGGGYVVWDASAPCPPDLALLDGDSYAARFELESPRLDKNLKLVWIGDDAPAGIWRSFPRPLNWSAIVAATDAQFGLQAPLATTASPADAADADLDVDIDLDFSGADQAPTSAASPTADTQPGELDLDLGLDQGFGAADEEWASDTQPAADEPVPPRALVIAPRLEDRLYLRARLSLAGLTQMDEAPDAAQGLTAARDQAYALVVLDLDMAQRSGWDALRALRTEHPRIAHVVAFSVQHGWWTRYLVRRAGANACLSQPFDPRKVYLMLEKVKQAT